MHISLSRHDLRALMHAGHVASRIVSSSNFTRQLYAVPRGCSGFSPGVAQKSPVFRRAWEVKNRRRVEHQASRLTQLPHRAVAAGRLPDAARDVSQKIPVNHFRKATLSPSAGGRPRRVPQRRTRAKQSVCVAAAFARRPRRCGCRRTWRRPEGMRSGAGFLWS